MIRKSMPSGDEPMGGSGFPSRQTRNAFARRSCSNKKIERDDDSKKSHHALGKKPEVEPGEAVADVFNRARLEAEPFGHHPQIETQFLVAVFDVVSNFAAFKRGEQRVGDPPPSHPLPFLQLTDLAA